MPVGVLPVEVCAKEGCIDSRLSVGVFGRERAGVVRPEIGFSSTDF
jgi:hypothetical protein